MDLFLLAEQSFLGAALQTASETVQAFPTLSTFAGIAAAVMGALKMFGIGPTQYKEYLGKLITLLGTLWKGDSVTEKVTLMTLEKILSLLLDKLLEEDVAPAEAEKIVNAIAPLVQKARLETFQQAVKDKCDQAKAEESERPKGDLPQLAQDKGDDLPPLAGAL